ncbi:hypothetical protein CEP51_006542 [Fusarium floridanum]|uniref:Nephrocystin 3-like N-terminal domain-containing protein n=1 Tax=Fusarium floridanum TaxID=1325733 RepID=A0A428RSU0_9HYPO|nr:hypothetical protein CEP51_006542 [Fusarium floridanum]
MNSRMLDVTVAAKGTLAWLSKHPMHDTWVKNDQGVLWIRGKPGSGKSTLMRRVLESTKKMLENDKEVLILSFFFHGRGTALQRSPLGLYRSLLHQLLDAAPDIMIDLVESYKRNNKTRGECGTAWNWDQNELRDFLEGALREVSRTVSVWLFIDALDEVGEKDAVDLIQMSGSLIKDLPALTKFRFCFASRHYPVLTQDFKVNICLEDENLGDISEFVKTNLKIFSTNIIPDLVIERAGGIFMWARLVTERVLKLNREGMDGMEIEAQVHGVTPDLDDLYAEVLARLDDVASVQLFDWVCFARRPLTPEELLSAIGVKIPEPLGESQDADESSVSGDPSRPHLSRMERRIGSLSGGLAEFVMTENGDQEPSTVVQFIHQSVQDFYVTKGLALVHDNPTDTTISQQIGKTHDCLLRACIRYRLPDATISQQIGEFHDFLSRGTSDNPNTDDGWLTRYASAKAKFPLLAYAISSWSHHARESQERGSSLDYLLEEEYLDWPSAHREQVLSKSWIKTGHNSHACSILHLLAAEGLVGPLRVLIRQARDEGNVFIDVRDRQGKTPLVRAVECGRTEVVKLFVNETIPVKTGNWLRFNSQKTLPSPPQVNFNLIHDERTILSKAVRSRNRAVVRLLINSGKLNVNQHLSEREFAGMTALSHAILAQEYDIMQDLLDCEQVDPNVMRWEDSSLYWAISQKDHIALKALLNSSKVNVNQTTFESFIAAYPPLTYAARGENWHAVKALLETERVHAGIKRSRMPRLNFMDPHPSAAYVLIHENQIELLVKLRDAKVDGQAPSEEEKFSRMKGAIEEVLENPDMPPDEVQKLAEELMGDNVAEARIWGMDFPLRNDIFLY